MKHLNMMIAAAALSLPMLASAEGYTVTPAPGVVEKLDEFVIAFNQDGLAEVELDAYSVEVRKDGKLFSEIKKKGYGFTYTCTLSTPATEAGDYEVVIAAGGIIYWSDGYAKETPNEEAITFTYTIEEGAVVAPDYTLSPEPGVVEELTQFEINFSRDNYESVELESSSVNVYKDGKLFSDIKKKGYDFDFTCTLNTPATEPGDYEVVIDAYGVTYYDAEYNETFNTEPIKFTYTIKAPLTEGVVYDIAFTKFNPAEGEVDLTDFQFENFKMYTSGTGLKLNTGASVTITSSNGYESTGTFRCPFANYYYAPVQMITKNGTYTVTIPAATVVDAEYIETEGKSGHANAETTVVYTVINGAAAGDPVVYDLQLASVTPKEGNRDLSMNSFESISLSLPADCNFATDKFSLVMTAPAEQGDINLDFTNSWNGVLAFFTEPKYDGEYILVIPQGMFGDATWMLDHECGHSNAEITLKWTLTGGLPTSVEVIESEATDAPVYNMQGIKVADTLRQAGAGMFIVNGRKVVIKK